MPETARMPEVSHDRKRGGGGGFGRGGADAGGWVGGVGEHAGNRGDILHEDVHNP